jgi:hypothetical protein
LIIKQDPIKIQSVKARREIDEPSDKEEDIEIIQMLSHSNTRANHRYEYKEQAPSMISQGLICSITS